jgi:hypothetical protein
MSGRRWKSTPNPASAGCNSKLTHYSITPLLHYSITPLLHHSITPSLHHSITPSLHHSTCRIRGPGQPARRSFRFAVFKLQSPAKSGRRGQPARRSLWFVGFKLRWLAKSGERSPHEAFKGSQPGPLAQKAVTAMASRLVRVTG